AHAVVEVEPCGGFIETCFRRKPGIGLLLGGQQRGHRRNLRLHYDSGTGTPACALFLDPACAPGSIMCALVDSAPPLTARDQLHRPLNLRIALRLYLIAFGDAQSLVEYLGLEAISDEV